MNEQIQKPVNDMPLSGSPRRKSLWKSLSGPSSIYSRIDSGGEFRVWGLIGASTSRKSFLEQMGSLFDLLQERARKTRSKAKTSGSQQPQKSKSPQHEQEEDGLFPYEENVDLERRLASLQPLRGGVTTDGGRKKDAKVG